MAAADGAIVKVLQTIYDYVHEDPAAQAGPLSDSQDPQYFDPTAMPDYIPAPAAMQQTAFAPAASPEYMQANSLPYMQQSYTQSSPAAFQSQQQAPGTSYSPESAYASGDAYSSPTGIPQQTSGAGWPQQYPVGMQYPMGMLQQQQQQQYAQQQYNVGMQQQQQHMQGAAAGAVPQHMMGSAVQFAAAYPSGSYAAGPEAGMPSIEYDKRPRAVEYKPYTQQDYSSRNYDAKTQKEYWKLGTLGPQIEDEDLQVCGWHCLLFERLDHRNTFPKGCAEPG